MSVHATGGSLELSGWQLSAAQVLALDATAAVPSLGQNGQHALAFSREWLSGADAFEVHTSGSTGEPKAIRLARSQMEASARATGTALGLADGDRALVCLPTRYIAGRMMLVRGWVLGLHMTLVEPASDPLRDLPPDVTFDFTALVPLQMQALLEGPAYYRRTLDRMKAILVGGGPISPALTAAVGGLDAPVFHTYGMTETATHVALRRLNGPTASPAFVPLPGAQLALDERGCLAIRGPMAGDGWLYTNDRVDLRPDGTFVWLGRWDNLINSGGVKVQVEKVEHAFEAVAALQADAIWAHRRFFVTGLGDERLGQVVTLVMQGPPLAAADEATIRGLLQDRLDRYELPRRFIYAPALVLTPTGKIDRLTTLAELALD